MDSKVIHLRPETSYAIPSRTSGEKKNSATVGIFYSDLM